MLHRIFLIEKRLIATLSVLLIVFSLINLYFIIDLLSYDELIAYSVSGQIKNSSPRSFAFLFFITTVSNLLFVSVSLLARLLSRYPLSGRTRKKKKYRVTGGN